MTTWLARLVPDERRPDVTEDLRDTGRLHRRIMGLFPDGLGENARAVGAILFRVDDDPRGTSVLVQSAVAPDIARLPDGYAQSAVRTLDPLLEALRPGLPVRYRLTANATRKLGRNTTAGKPLTVVPLHAGEAEAWWARKAGEAGLELRVLSAVSLDPAKGVRHSAGSAQRQLLQHARTRFDGTALIIDPERLRAALAGGVGRAKSYGCGLLTIAPTR
jgi:CRISPR system Cascade subunit CasE